MREIYLGLGSNVGNKRENIARAIQRLGESTQILRGSSLYKTEPVGYRDQDWFVNCVVEVETELTAQELLAFVLSVEQELGRVRTIQGGPRTIDIDIIFYASHVIDQSGLKVPHPRLHERLFVLAPLAEICPEFVHPVLGIAIRELAARRFDQQEVTRLSASGVTHRQAQG